MTTMEETLWNYIEGNCSMEEKITIEQLINRDDAWRSKLAELQQVQHLLGSNLELEEPSLRFRQNIMESIAKHQIAPATKAYIDKRIIYGIGSFFITTIIGFHIFMVSQISWFGNKAESDFSPIDFNKIDWNQIFKSHSTTTLIMINVVLGLMFLDRYLGHKRHQLKENKS